MNPIQKLSRSPLISVLFVSIIVFLGIMGLRNSGLLESTELIAYDYYVRLLPKDSAPNPHIVLIKVTEKDIRNQGGWPLTDATVAKVLETIIHYRPRVIGLDIYRDIPVPPGSEEFAMILTKNRNIITAMKFGSKDESGIPPASVLKEKEQAGFNDILVDSGGIVRRGLLFLDDGDNIFYSFALRISLLYLREKGIVPQADVFKQHHIRLGQTTIRPFESNDGSYINADARGYQFLLDFKDTPESFTSYSLTTLLSGKIDPEAIKDKIVLIGTEAESVKDFFYTPYSRGLFSHQHISGITLHAHIINQLLRFALEGDKPIATVNEWHEWFWITLWSLLGGALGFRVRSPWRFSLLATSGLFVLALAVYFAFLSSWWIPLVPSFMSWLISASVITAYMSNKEKRERAFLMQLFSKHVSKEVAEIIWKQRDQFLEGGRLRSQKSIVTVMFTDIKGFTSVAEKMNPQALIDWLNTYMEAMAHLVMAHGGLIDDYTGDGIKADFGVPVPRTSKSEIVQDAVNAVNCALDMERELKRLNTTWEENNLPTVHMRIGIFTGPVIAGSLGSAERLKYTTIGDTVNIASRLENFDKDFAEADCTRSPCRILIGEKTLNYLDNEFKVQRVGEVSLKGKSQEITAYRVIGRLTDT